ncbi:MAG: hypothetical protein RLZZ219_249 [Cyanobacteriota bacterium]
MIETLPPHLQACVRGDWAGRFDGFGADGQLQGWACDWPPGSHPRPLEVELWIEDLLVPGSARQLATLPADQRRQDLQAVDGLPACGFELRGPLTLQPPERTTGTVLRAVLWREGQLQELPGSPLRLDPDRYQQFLGLCRRGPRSPFGLNPVEGPWIHGWAPPGSSPELWLDGALLVQTSATAEGRFLHPLPGAACDGRLHHLELRSSEGVSLAERLDFTPFQLIPWPALLEHGQPPLPYGFEPMGRERHRCLAIALEMAEAGTRPLPADLPRLQRLLYGPLELPPFAPPLALPTSETPLVSVVVPVHGKLPVTRRCLAALCYAPTAIPFEVVLVDDGCPEHSAERLAAEVKGLRSVRHPEGQGFNQACHSGVAAARGAFVVLLNNDTEPCARWLEELLDPFERWIDTGLSGAQLVYPDGRLQEAGGIVWGNGEPWNYGRGGNPYAPPVAYARQVDYLSGAAVAIRRELWDRIGGFSPEFAPAYYEDTDLAFKVRAAGFTVRYAPLARVIHHEGLSNGTDVEAEQGMKRFQALHAPVFRSKWAQAFLPSGDPSHAEAELIKDRGIVGRALFIDHGPPRPDRDAGSHAALVEMDLVQRLGWKVTFLPANLAWLGGYSEELQRRGIESIHAPFCLGVEQFLRERGGEFELIYLTRYTTVRDHLADLRAFAPRARLLFCNADLHYLREIRQLRAARLEGEALRSACEALEETRRHELQVIAAVDLTLTYSEVEQGVIEAESRGRAATALAPWVVDTVEQAMPLQGRSGLAFLGSYGHPPNRDAVAFFLAEVWPLLRQQHPDLHLHLYGSGLSEEQRQAWAAEPGVIVEGWVADTTTVYDRHRVCIAPLRAGAGLKGKVVGALARGMPQVLSPMAAEATGLRDGQEFLLAESPHDWLQQVGRLLHDDGLWQAISAAALAHARSHYCRSRGLARMAAALRQLNLPVLEATP